MNVGDLVKVKVGYATPAGLSKIGVVIEAQRGFYKIMKKNSGEMRPYQDRYRVYWADGRVTEEPEGYIEALVEEEPTSEN